MRLPTEFIQLPVTFDAARLAEEIAGFDESDWRPHPEGHAGNSALPLVAVGGDPGDDGVKGAMRPTPFLARCPYLRQLLESLGAPIGRTRLMRIDGNAEATAHVDVNYYWQTRVRIHVPIVSDPAVRFLCGERSLHMAPGQAWIFDTWRLHNVINPQPTRRIHLVADTAGSPRLRELIDGGWDPFSGLPGPASRWIAFDPDRSAEPRTEVHNFPVVMRPEEQHALFAIFADDLRVSVAGQALDADVRAFLESWRELWRRYEADAGGWRAYAELLATTEPRVARHSGAVRLPNGVDAAYAVQQILLRPALNTDLAPRTRQPAGHARQRFDRPIFIVSSPRSGSSLLFETLARSPSVVTTGGESHALVEGIEALHPAAHGWESNRLTAADATEVVADDLSARFAAAAADRDGRPPAPGRFRFLEKTPKNALRVPFLRALFPDAFFIYLYRDERATISSMIEAWRSGRFITYPELPGWEGHPWSLLLTPGWRQWIGLPLPEIASRQWRAATELLLADLQALPPETWCVAGYDRLIADPQREIARLCDFIGVEWDGALTAPLPPSRHTLTPPDREKWKRHAEELAPLLPSIEPVAERARELFAQAPLQRNLSQASPPPETPAPFRSIHTTSFPQLLAELRISLLVSTYQSGRLVMLRADGETLNTHFRYFPSPMGLAFDGDRLAIGTLSEVWDYRNVPAAAARLHPGKHDACFLPRNMHVTGDIRVHELAFAGDGELWLVSTRFSALCTLDRDHSFVPRWRPPFITKLAAEDRCHLNGLGMVDGLPRFATALGATDTSEGWRAQKAGGGIVIDIPSGEIISTGLSMPHSPRLYDGRVWVLESAKGTLSTLDVASGKREIVAELPGFTRGLAFAGPIAFVGLSQVRERVFDDIPLGERLRPDERSCGVWVIDLRTGAILGFVRFEEAVQEIFDIQILPGIVYPDLLEPGADLVQASLVLSPEAIAET